ncbi:restriction endonuclease subunit S [Campylobacter coli]|uniref:Restriction endonuclease subunit S n=1 Tax=Campylobacter coli TaxID=195 RepID=A0A691WXA4_CAMCO|nr:restriction endonuclease subunit S [Campylobacter coli]EAI0962559.1 restriction endonuclease subunit S [Campylobacter coli]EAI3792836.1 restriction endonuclease subunit S [Campylobacter coli]EAK4357409.1 restriction endonuclease subunit S [Campylobacter coli]HEE9623608.1 restriction endonuclease subunit S [Campylobacter coli]
MNLNQTLQEKYPHLEVSVFSYSKVKEHLIFGSEFNSNTRENAIQSIVSNKNVNDYFELINTNVSTLKEFIYIYDLTHSLGNFMIDVEPTQEIGSNKKEAIKGDFVISRLRSYLKEMAVIQSKNFKQLLSTEYLVYRPKTNLLSSNTLLAFSLSRIVQTILNYSQYGTEHPRFYEFVFNEMPIPKCLLLMNAEIDSIMNKAYEVLEQSKIFYKKAEETLYLELGLDPKNPLQSLLDSKTNNPTKSLNISIHTLKESFLKTGRLDSEYYQKKYEINEKIIMNKKYTVLDNLVSITKSIEPGSNLYKNKGIPFIRVANLTQYGLSEGDVFLDEKDFFPQYLQILYPKKDTILFSKDGSVGIAYCVKEDKEVITSGAILHLNIKDKENILPEYLTLFLNSIFVKLQAQRDCGGSIISHWRIEDIKKVLVAILDIKIQEKIAKYIQESFNLRKKSKQLLDNAKNKVEEQIQGKI